jgi:NAD(P)-dependent dehydrogenase (short-subunit alcohol dehydrogenase family)
MKLKGCVALVTGGNRGIGKAFVEGLLAAGAKKVYAAARNPNDVGTQGAVPISLDITNPEQVALACERCEDVNVLVNNAGVGAVSPLIGSPDLRHVRAAMETNFFGTLNMCRAFAPILKRNGGGALVNMLSVVSWSTAAFLGGYSASKTAELALTRGVRIELRSQGTLVVGVYAGLVDTDMARALTGTRVEVAPQHIVSAVLSGLTSDVEEILADDRAREIATNFITESSTREKINQQVWDASPYSKATDSQVAQSASVVRSRP